MTRYLVLTAYVPDDWESASEAVIAEYFAAHQAFEEYVDKHGRRLGSAALAGADTATTVRHVDSNATVTDGPFVELTEQIGGYYDIELLDLDTAIAAGKLLPSSYAVEIRPTMTIEGYESA